MVRVLDRDDVRRLVSMADAIAAVREALAAADRGGAVMSAPFGMHLPDATEQAADAVRQAILSGRLLPGTPLREAALAAELGVSRSTLREAARTLASEGLVRYQMNRGIVVTESTAEDVADIYAARAAVSWPE